MPALLPLLISNWRIVAVVAGGLALAGWLGCERIKLLNEGAQRERAKIEDANDAAKQRADDGAKTVEDCYLRGGSWDRPSGRCLPDNAARK